MKNLFLVVVALAVLTGCYHATIETGLAPGTQTLNDKWADSWVYGLVPPSTVETMDRCPNGVSRVETRQSFLNGLVNALTWGIYAPMEILVTCAAGQEQNDAPTVFDADSFSAALHSGGPFYVRLN